MKKFILTAIALSALCFLFLPPPSAALAQEANVVNLPPPNREGGMPLNEALNQRRSHRAILPTELPIDQVSQILWSAFGVNREAGKMRTIPTSHNRQNMLVFAVLKTGVWLYEAEKNQLSLQLRGDFTGDFSSAPLTILYVVPVADGNVGGIHVGLAAQSVGLTCASLGLANVVKTTGADYLKGKLPLPSGFHTLAIHNVGQPSGLF
ncbi:MAG: nitroreductase family protein [Deltaproteobacteria bacterium]|nr:nitroreductase family protein [Deltaproteobacteria bacterium]